MLILSRKRGESIVLPGGLAVSTLAGVVPPVPVPVGGDGPSGGGEGGPPACPALATIPGTDRRSDRPDP